MHWFWKLVIALAGLFVVVVIALIFVIYIALPSPAKLREGLFAKATSVVAAHQAKPSQPGSTPGATPAVAAAVDADAANADARAKVEENERLFAAFIDKSAPLSQACDSLRSIRYPQQKKLEVTEFAKRFKKSLEAERNDPQFESLKPILKFTLTQPVMLDVIDRVRTAKPQSMIEEFKTKKDFYFLLADAYEEMKQNRVAMEDILDGSYLTMMLGRAVEANPALASDPAVGDFCRGVEAGLNEESPVDFAGDKKSFEKLLAESGVDPKSIGYNPDYKTNLQIVFNEHGLHFTGGWIDEVFAQLAPPKKER